MSVCRPHTSTTPFLDSSQLPTSSGSFADTTTWANVASAAAASASTSSPPPLSDATKALILKMLEIIPEILFPPLQEDAPAANRRRQPPLEEDTPATHRALRPPLPQRAETEHPFLLKDPRAQQHEYRLMRRNAFCTDVHQVFGKHLDPLHLQTLPPKGAAPARARPPSPPSSKEAL